MEGEKATEEWHSERVRDTKRHKEKERGRKSTLSVSCVNISLCPDACFVAFLVAS